MMKRMVAAVLSASLSVGTPAMVFAQDGESAAEEPLEEFQVLTQEASEAYDAGDYARAVDLFEQAYAVRPVSNILYNIGRIHEDAGNIDDAISYYDKFVVAPNVEQNSRRDALDRLKTLREVKKMQAGEEEPDAVVAETPPPAQPEEPKSSNAVGWTFMGIGGAALVGSGVFALLTQSQFQRFEDASNLEERRAASSSGRTNAVVADALLVTGAVSAVVGGVFLIASGSKEKESAVKVSPIVGSHALGIGLDFDF